MIVSDEELAMTKLEFQDKGYVMQWYVMSSQIILTTMGKDWWLKNCSKMKKKSENSFFSFDDGRKTTYESQDRLIHFGHLLYLLKNCKGYDLFVESLKRKDIESSYWELSVASLFIESEYQVEFIKETGKRGLDYDLEVTKNSSKYQVEAKNRNNNPKNEEALRNTLGKARKQLPKDGNGIIVVSIPLSWTQKVEAEENIGQIIKSFLKKTSRIRYVIIFWREWFDNIPIGKKIVEKFRIYPENTSKDLYLNTVEDSLKYSFTPAFWK